MSMTLDTTALADHLLPLALSKSPPGPPVARIEIEESLDSTDYPSLFIWVLFPDSVTEEEQSWEAVSPMHDAIVEEIRRLQDPRWPYVRFRRESEYDHRLDEDYWEAEASEAEAK